MSNVFSGLAPEAIDVTLVEAIELLQADLRALRVHVGEVVDDYRAVCVRSAEPAGVEPTVIGAATPGGPGVDELSRTIAELAALLLEA